MLADPNDESPANVDAAKEWREAYPEFKYKYIFYILKINLRNFSFFNRFPLFIDKNHYFFFYVFNFITRILSLHVKNGNLKLRLVDPWVYIFSKNLPPPFFLKIIFLRVVLCACAEGKKFWGVIFVEVGKSNCWDKTKKLFFW